MRKVKFVFWAIVLAIILFIGWQNQDFFFQRHAIKVDIGLVSYQTPNLAMLIYLLFFLLTGFLIAFFLGIGEKFRIKKAMRKLNENLEAEEKRALDLETKLNSVHAKLSQEQYTEIEKQADNVST